MRYVTVEKLVEGMCVGRNICDQYNRIILTRGQILNSAYIRDLKELGHKGIYIEDVLSAGIDIDRVISPNLRTAAFEAVARQDLDACKKAAASIVMEIATKGLNHIDLTELKSNSDHTYNHSVNVAVTSCIMGIAKGYRPNELYDLCVAALLHDLGKMHIPVDILDKPSKLTPEEYEIVKTHPMISYNLIKNYSDFSIDTKLAILFHHENVDGSGYPKGLTAKDLTPFANIIHVADVYDALTSQRPYKQPYSPFEACEYLMGGCGIMFDKATVELLTKSVPLYPKGTEVVLSNGLTGIIYENAGVHNLRPVVRVNNGMFIDLAERNNLNISVKALDVVEASVENDRDVSKNKPLVYIVDDMLTNIAMLEEILEKKYEVVSFMDGEEIVEKLPSMKKPEIILMDIDMPGMHGIEAAEIIIKEYDGQIPILFVSALSNFETVMEVKRIKAAGYVVRPYNNMYILGEIDRILCNYGDY